MVKYDSYKDSGVEWIGEIPSHWSNSKLKYETKITMGQSPSSEFYNDEGQGFPFLQGNSEFSQEHPTHKLNTTQITKKSYIGDILFSVRGSVGEINWSNIEYCIGRGLCSISPYKIEPKLLWYFLIFSKDELLSISVGSTFVSITTDDILNHQISLPPNQEQQQIVSFLDTKTSLIDSLIEKTQKKIELLKERRTSLINHTVTKGLNPNVEMRDSGVEWIGEIPIHWYLNKVGNNTYVKGRIGWKGLRSEDFIDEGPFLITGTDFNKDGTINWENMYHVSQERYDEDPFIQLQDEDVLITKDGTIGKVVFVGNLKGQTCLNSGIFLTRPTNKEYISKFFYWILKSTVFNVFVDYNSGGSTIQHLYQNVFVNFKTPIPPISEQQQIVEYLDEQTNIIDTTITKEQKRVKLLKEYRQSLISEVVTGKIKVTNE